MSAPNKRPRRKAGKPNFPVAATISQAFEDGRSAVQDLKQEIEDWKDSLESNSMEHLPKYEDVSECQDALDGGCSTLEGIDVPDFLEDTDAPYTQDTRTAAQSRNGRLSNALNALGAAKDAVDGWLNDNPELEHVSPVEEGGPDDLMENQTTDEEALNERDQQRGDAEEFLNELDSAISELENVSFPGMY